MRFEKGWAAVMAFAAMAAALHGAALDPLLEKPAALWNTAPETLERQYPGAFRWMEQQKRRLRFGRAAGAEPLTLFGEKLQEVICEFRDGKIAGMDLSFYNRGDSGAWEVKPFNRMTDELTRRAGARFGAGTSPARQTATMDTGKVVALIWRTQELDTVLRWSISNRDEPEYILLSLYPAGCAPKTLRGGMKAQTSERDLKSQIQVDSAGAFYLDIPMVDQGAKGYCVAATVARVLNYYGADVDQHLIAQLAKSDAERGTNLAQTIAGLEKVQNRLGVRIKRYYSGNWNTWGDIAKLVKNYNRLARKEKLPDVEFERFIVNDHGRKVLDFAGLMAAFDADTFCKLRAQEKNERQSFFNLVRQSIDDGLPLCWATFILPGLNGEPNAGFGLHMRIINGYNPTTREIVYTDSWGAGHEKKIMPLDTAWGITTHLFGLIPRNSHAPGK